MDLKFLSVTFVVLLIVVSIKIVPFFFESYGNVYVKLISM